MNGREKIRCAGAARTLDDLPWMLSVERAARGLSLRDAAAEIGVGFNTLYRVEIGRTASAHNVRKMLAWLAGNAMQPPPSATP